MWRLYSNRAGCWRNAMTEMFFSRFGFVFPALMALAPLVLGFLVYIYLRRGRGRRVQVPTLLLLKNLQRTHQARKSFFPPPRFFLELVVLLLLVGGVAGIFLRGEDLRVAIVLDNSLSMSAAFPTAGTQLSRAKMVISDVLDELPDSVSIFPSVSSPEFHALASEGVGKNEAARLFESVQALQAKDKLAENLPRFIGDPRFDRVVVVTDRRIETPKSDLSNVMLDVRTLTSEETGHFYNIAISRAALVEKKGEMLPQATVANYSPERVMLKIILEELENNQFREINARALTIEAGKESSIEFSTLPSSFHGGRVRLEVPAALSRLNSIREDDLYFVGGGGGSEPFGVVSDLSLAELGLQNVHGLSFRSIDSDANWTLQRAIIHRRSVESLPPKGALIILPSADKGIFAAQHELREQVVTNWQKTHSLLSYVNLAALKLQKLVSFEKPMWMETLISATEGPIALVGEKTGGRYVVFGFELLPFEGKSSPASSILLLNALKWISQDSLAFEGARAYENRQVSSGLVSARYINRGENLLDPRQRDRVLLAESGLVSLRFDAREDLLAVNFYDQSESDLIGARPIVLESAKRQVEALGSRRTLVQRIALVILLLLLLDLGLAARKRRELRAS